MVLYYNNKPPDKVRKCIKDLVKSFYFFSLQVDPNPPTKCVDLKFRFQKQNCHLNFNITYYAPPPHVLGKTDTILVIHYKYCCTWKKKNNFVVFLLIFIMCSPTLRIQMLCTSTNENTPLGYDEMKTKPKSIFWTTRNCTFLLKSFSFMS